MTADPAAAKALFLDAVALADPAARAALLDDRCGGDDALRARVLALLAANDQARANERTASFGSTGPTADPEAAPTADYAGRDEHVGAILGGKYKLIEAIGEGGMGSVYTAQQTEPVKRLVAVKVIKAGMDSKAVLARFEAERQALAMMDHPNIARVLDAGATEGGRPYFVMELVKGVPITQFCDERKLTPQQRLELFVPVCNAIQHAHQKGVIHRDIKPSNVLVALYDDRPVPKVIDFGVAKATGQTLTENTLVTGFGAVVGTPEYMSPEQASLNNLDIDTRSDVYALGVLLYELLTGTTPVDRKSLGKAALLEVLRIVREVEAPRPSAKLSTSDTLPSISANRGIEPRKLTGLLRSELDWIVLKALEKDRTRRYDTANGFAADVQRYLSGEPVLAHPPSAGYRLRTFVRRNRPQVIAATLVFVALVAGMVGTALGLVEARRQTDIARDEAFEKEKARAEEEKQRTLAQAARDRAATSDVFSRKTIDAIVDMFVADTLPTGEPRPMTQEERVAKHAVEWERYRDFYEREITDHPTGERHEAAVLRLGLAFAMLKRQDDSVRTLDRLLDAVYARLQTNPRHPATLKLLVEATKVRSRAPLLMLQNDEAWRESDRFREAFQPRWEALARNAPDVFEYHRQAIHNSQAPLVRLYAAVAEQARESRRLDERKGPMPLVLPPELVQRIAAYQDRLCACFRHAVAHFPPAAADARWLRGAILETLLRDRSESGVPPVPPAVRDELLTALIRADLRRSVAAGPQERHPGDNGWKDEMLGDYLAQVHQHSKITGSKMIRYRSDAVRAVSAAWRSASQSVPEYPWADAFTPALQTELFIFSRAEAGQSLTPELRVEMVAAQRRMLDDVLARPPLYAFHTGVSLQEDLLEKTTLLAGRDRL